MIADPLTKPLGPIGFKRKMATIMTTETSTGDISSHGADDDNLAERCGPESDMADSEADTADEAGKHSNDDYDDIIESDENVGENMRTISDTGAHTGHSLEGEC